MIGVKKLQDFSKAMIGPVLYLPAIGLLIALFSMTTNRLWVDESSGLYLVGKFVSSMLWALMNHLGFLFCLGLASGLAKTRKAEAAFVAAMTWLMYLAANNSWLTLTHRLATGATNAQLYGSGQTFIFGFQVIDMGVFLGIILGCAVAFVHNRVIGIEFRGALSIYGNSKLVLIVMLPLVGMFAIATVYLWPVVELGISALTGFMKSFGAIGVFLYGFLNRFLIPTGLHHLIWSPFVFTSIGGQLLIDGQTVIGAKPIFLAEIARHPVDALSDSARFLTYGMVKIFGTAGMALAFYRGLSTPCWTVFSRCWPGCFTSGSAPLTVSSISSSITSRRESARRAGRCLSPSVCWKPRPCTWSAPSVLPVCGCSPRAAKPQPKMSIRNRLIASIRIKARW
ncbi:PTS system glucose-like IIBC component [Klebsiella pneumoniae]|nr:PTS system glucose-like IIBC component [Klebsiella pneumoniae]